MSTPTGQLNLEAIEARVNVIRHVPEDVRALVAEIRRLQAELADFSGRVNELESRLCDCEPVREHDDYRRPAFYRHASHCAVNATAHPKGGDDR